MTMNYAHVVTSPKKTLDNSNIPPPSSINSTISSFPSMSSNSSGFCSTPSSASISTHNRYSALKLISSSDEETSTEQHYAHLSYMIKYKCLSKPSTWNMAFEEILKNEMFIEEHDEIKVTGSAILLIHSLPMWFNLIFPPNRCISNVVQNELYASLMQQLGFLFLYLPNDTMLQVSELYGDLVPQVDVTNILRSDDILTLTKQLTPNERFNKLVSVILTSVEKIILKQYASVSAFRQSLDHKFNINAVVNQFEEIIADIVGLQHDDFPKLNAPLVPFGDVNFTPPSPRKTTSNLQFKSGFGFITPRNQPHSVYSVANRHVHISSDNVNLNISYFDAINSQLSNMNIDHNASIILSPLYVMNSNALSYGVITGKLNDSDTTVVWTPLIRALFKCIANDKYNKLENSGFVQRDGVSVIEINQGVYPDWCYETISQGVCKYLIRTYADYLAEFFNLSIANKIGYVAFAEAVDDHFVASSLFPFLSHSLVNNTVVAQDIVQTGPFLVRISLKSSLSKTPPDDTSRMYFHDSYVKYKRSLLANTYSPEAKLNSYTPLATFNTSENVNAYPLSNAHNRIKHLIKNIHLSNSNKRNAPQLSVTVEYKCDRYRKWHAYMLIFDEVDGDREVKVLSAFFCFEQIMGYGLLTNNLNGTTDVYLSGSMTVPFCPISLGDIQVSFDRDADLALAQKMIPLTALKKYRFPRSSATKESFYFLLDAVFTRKLISYTQILVHAASLYPAGFVKHANVHNNSICGEKCIADFRQSLQGSTNLHTTLEAMLRDARNKGNIVIAHSALRSSFNNTSFCQFAKACSHCGTKTSIVYSQYLNSMCCARANMNFLHPNRNEHSEKKNKISKQEIKVANTNIVLNYTNLHGSKHR
ncbi:98.1 kDa protein [Psammotettix alienus reovirus]|nr:98.1 kDa protein [Psammotettix alienus reovirus]